MTQCRHGLIAAAFVLVLGSAAFGQAEMEWDQLASKVLAGEKLSVDTIDKCDREFRDYGATLGKKNKCNDLNGLCAEDNAVHYVNAIRMSIINPQQHGGWPFRHDGRARAYGVIKQRLEKETGPALMAAAIIPAIDNDDVPFAIATLKKLQAKDAAWAKYILAVVQRSYADRKPAETFVEAFVPGFSKREKKPPKKPWWQPEPDATTTSFETTCNGKRYISYMTATILRQSPTLDLGAAELPKSPEEIKQIGLAKVKEIAGSIEGWILLQIRITLPREDFVTPDLHDRWCYFVEFANRSPRPQQGSSLYVPVTVDGRVGVVKPKNEESKAK